MFRDPAREREGDLKLRFLTVEVKTWAAGRSWIEWGRCVTESQLPSLRAKTNVILWCHVDERRDVEVTIAGWSALEDLAVLGPIWTGPEGRQVKNHQLPIEDVRDLRTLPL